MNYTNISIDDDVHSDWFGSIFRETCRFSMTGGASRTANGGVVDRQLILQL
jgi:hypothetical protein